MPDSDEQAQQGQYDIQRQRGIQGHQFHLCACTQSLTRNRPFASGCDTQGGQVGSQKHRLREGLTGGACRVGAAYVAGAAYGINTTVPVRSIVAQSIPSALKAVSCDLARGLVAASRKWMLPPAAAKHTCVPA